jgi:hypothetical protein
MPKRSAKHQSFKLSPHKHTQERVIIYVLIAVVVGLVLGWYFKDDFSRMIYGSGAPLMGY